MQSVLSVCILGHSPASRFSVSDDGEITQGTSMTCSSISGVTTYEAIAWRDDHSKVAAIQWLFVASNPVEGVSRAFLVESVPGEERRLEIPTQE